MKFFGFLSLLGAIVGALVLLSGMFTAQSAPQEAAIGALAIAIAVIPYVFFRVLQALRQADDMAAIRRLLEARPGRPTGATAPPPQVAAPALVAPRARAAVPYRRGAAKRLHGRGGLDLAPAQRRQPAHHRRPWLRLRLPLCGRGAQGLHLVAGAGGGMRRWRNPSVPAMPACAL